MRTTGRADFRHLAVSVALAGMTHDGNFIGNRVARLRTISAMSQQRLAELAGVTQPYIALIESGRKPVTKRSLLYALANALEVPYTELTEQPLPPRNREDLLTYSAVASIRAALDYPDEPVRPRPRGELHRVTGQVMAARMECDYAAVGAGLPALLAELRAAYDNGHPRWAGEMLVRALVTGSLTLKPVGWQDLAMRLAEQARIVAAQLGDATSFAAAEFCYAQGVLASGSRRRSLAIARAAGAQVDPVSNDTRAWRAALFMHAGLSAAILGDVTESDGFFTSAGVLAETVEGDPWLMEINPANVDTWRVGAAVENGRPDRAPVIAAQVDRRQLHTRQRRCRLDMDLGRGQYLSGHPDRAVDSFLRAHEVARLELRTRPSVIEIVSQMVRDTPSPSRELRTLAGHVGVAIL